MKNKTGEKTKQTASEYYLENLKKMEDLVKQLFDLQEEGQKALENFTIADLREMSENKELNEQGEKVVLMIKELTSGL